MSKKKRSWKDYLNDMSQNERNKLLRVIADHLMDQGESSDICFREAGHDPGEPPSKECLFWDGSGEPLI